VLIPIAAVGVAAALAHGAFHRNSPIFGSVLVRLPGQERRVALTFDDGPNPDATPRILDVLAREGVYATFFMLGRHVERWPSIASDVARAGHRVANHGYHHRKLHFKGPAYTRLDIALGADCIQEATGMQPDLFRAPHGFRSPWLHAIARDMGIRCVGWTVGVWDSDRPGPERIASRAIAGARPGAILLLHDGDGYDPTGDRRQTADAVPRIIHALRDAGYRFELLP
jgi:peptidoglycan-N-acetylglucosamine deacetylase